MKWSVLMSGRMKAWSSMKYINIQALMSRTQHDGSERCFLGMFGTSVFPVLALGSQKLTGNWMGWNVDSKSR